MLQLDAQLPVTLVVVEHVGRSGPSVVLGKTGAAGIQMAHRRGGFTIALSPDGLVYGAMPAAAIATGEVDMIITELAPLIRKLALAGHPKMRKAPVTTALG